MNTTINLPINKSLREIEIEISKIKTWNRYYVEHLDEYYRHKVLSAISINKDVDEVRELLDHLHKTIYSQSYYIRGVGCMIVIHNWIGYTKLLETWLSLFS